MGKNFRNFMRKHEGKEPQVDKKPLGKDSRGVNLEGADLLNVPPYPNIRFPFTQKDLDIFRSWLDQVSD